MTIANIFLLATIANSSLASRSRIAAFVTARYGAAHSNSNSWPTIKLETLKRYAVIESPRVSTTLQSKFDVLDDVFLLSIDGTLATISRSRSILAICVALKVWPTLTSIMEALGMSHEAFCLTNKKDFGYKDNKYEHNEWLLQKLSALSSITQQGNDPDAMLGCDEVLMVRLLLEEQLLDGGRSNGRGGKYGGKFHPSTTSPSSAAAAAAAAADGQGTSMLGSRPLTVGELYSNWSELRDVVRIKYPFIDEDSNGKANRFDPLPYIRQYMREIFSTTHQEGYVWQSLALDVLFDYRGEGNDTNGGTKEQRQNTMLLLSHDAQISSTLNSLSLLGYEFDIETDLTISDEGGELLFDRLSTQDNSKHYTKMKVVVTTSAHAYERLGQGLLLVVPDEQTSETHSNMIERIVFDFGERPQMTKNIYLIHSSLDVLKQCKPFLGEDAPKLSQGLRKCILPGASNISMTLFLPEWAENVHVSQKNVGEMDPWMNLLSEEQLLELISARITMAA